METSSLVEAQWELRGQRTEMWPGAGHNVHYVAIAHELDRSDLGGSMLHVHPDSLHLPLDKE